MDEKLVGNLKSSQDSILVAYQVKFQELRAQLLILKNQLSEEQKNLRRDETILNIEEERNWFRDELRKSDAKVKQQEEELKKLRLAYEEMVDDRNSLHAQCMSTKRENKVLFQEKIKREPPQRFLSLGPTSPGSRIPPSTARGVQRSRQSSQRAHTSQIFASPDPGLGSVAFSNPSKVTDEVIISLKRQLDAERNKLRKLVAQQVSERAQSIELREFFITCIEEVKKDIMVRGGVRSNSQIEDIDDAPCIVVRKPALYPFLDSPKAKPTLSAFTPTDKR